MRDLGYYLEELLLLAASCCEARNYAAISTLSPLFPYEILLSAIHSE